VKRKRKTRICDTKSRGAVPKKPRSLFTREKESDLGLFSLNAERERKRKVTKEE